MNSSYSTQLVVLSIVIACAASYAALFLAAHVARTKVRLRWLLAGATAMGIGIWSMHFIAMLAYRLPVTVGYDVPLVALSLLIAIAASVLGLEVAGRERPTRMRIALTGPVMGAAIAGMHYTGMAAVRLPGSQHYDAWLVTASVAIAVAASYAAIALFLRFRFDRTRRGSWLKVASAVVMGHAVAGMHYTAMAAVHFQHGQATTPGLLLPPDDLAVAIGILTTIVLALAVSGAMLDRWARTQRSIRESEERFRIMMDAMQDCAIFTADADGRVNSWNRGAERLLGYSAHEVLGEHIRKFLPEHDRGSADVELTTAERVGFCEAEGERRTKSGELRSIVVTTTPLRDQKGTLLGFARVLRDVTEKRRADEELKRTEDRLRQSQKMEAIGQLAGGVAHDFNNMLTAIRGQAELLRLGDVSNDELQLGLDEVITVADRAAALTRQLLAYSRKQVLQPRPVNPNCIVAEMEGMLKRLLVGHIELHTRLSSDVGQITVDPAQMQQVLLNLVLNARDAIPAADGGRILIETANVELDDSFCASHVGLRAGPHVVLSVSDTGRGMTTEVQRHMFEPFFTTKEIGAGTGLGLSTVYGIVKQSDGHIEVQSESGKGSMFRIYLPRTAEQAPSQRHHVQPAATPGAKGSVLVVDDEDSVRKFVAAVLTRAGYHVLVASNGAEALRMLDSNAGAARVDLVVTDVMMPGLHGRALAEHIDKHCPGTPVLFMSGYASDDVIQRGHLAMDTDFIQKPFTAAELLHKTRQTIARAAAAV